MLHLSVGKKYEVHFYSLIFLVGLWKVAWMSWSFRSALIVPVQSPQSLLTSWSQPFKRDAQPGVVWQHSQATRRVSGPRSQGSCKKWLWLPREHITQTFLWRASKKLRTPKLCFSLWKTYCNSGIWCCLLKSLAYLCRKLYLPLTI